MKKETRTIVAIVSVFALGLLVLAPYLFHKRETTGSNEIIASKAGPENMQNKEPIRTNPLVPATANRLQGPAVQILTKPVSPNDQPVLEVIVPQSVKTTTGAPNPAVKRKLQPKVYAGRPLAGKNDLPHTALKPAAPKLNQKAEPDSRENTMPPPRPSPWGVFILTTGCGVDGGISYRLAQIPIGAGLDLDLLAGIKQAGLGLNMGVYRNWGLGLTGTVRYTNGEKNLGIYGKYSF